MAGVTATGFERKRLVDVKTDLETKFKTIFGENIDLASESRFGQLIGTLSEEISDEWEGQERVYNAYNLSASGVSLSNNVSLVGITRLAAEHAIGEVTFSGTEGASVPASTEVQTLTGAVFLTSAAGNITSGTVDLPIIGKNAELLVATAGTITVINTAIFGITSVTNAAALSYSGRNEETDAELRVRHNSAVTAVGQNTADALASQLKNTEGILDALVIENKTEATVDGIPPHSYDTIVNGGDSTEIGRIIRLNSVIGIESNGDESVLTYNPEGFNPLTVYYTNSTPSAVYLAIILEIDALVYPPDGDTVLKQAIVDWAEGFYGIGDTVLYSKFFSIINELEGVISVDLSIGLAPVPTGKVNLAIGARSHSEYTTTNIGITHV